MLHDSSLQISITNVNNYFILLSLSNIFFYTVVIIYLTLFYKNILD